MLELSEYLQCQLIGDKEHIVCDVASLKSASSSDLSFYNDIRYNRDLLESRAGAVLVKTPPIEKIRGNWLIADDPSATFQKAIELFRPPIMGGFQGIHATAVVHPTAKVGERVTIGPHCCIERGVCIGDRTELKAQVYIGAQTQIGTDTILHPGVVVREGCQLADRVTVQPGAVVGSCGFGFTPSSSGHCKVEQRGGVVVECDVEIGACATIDRGRFENTVIGRGTKIDNLVQIAHSVQVGPHNILCAQTGLAGSCATGRFVTLAGQSAITGHVRLGDRVILSARAGASKNITAAGIYAGVPAIEIEKWRRQVVYLKQLPQMARELRLTQAKVRKLEIALQNALKWPAL